MEASVIEITEQEKREIVKRYRTLFRSARRHIKNRYDAERIRNAFDLAMSAHGSVRRKSGELYIYHPLEVARIAVDEIGLGVTSIICALLHDVVEDTEYSVADIREKFGNEVAVSVASLTKIKGAFEKGMSEQAENFRKLLLSLTDDIRVVLVKIADRLHNMRTLDSMAPEKRLKIQAETQFVYAPLAHRLGLYSIKSELEDLCLKYSDREFFDLITTKLAESRVARDLFIERFVGPLEEHLKPYNYPFKIKSRLKSVYSIYSKMKKQKVAFEEVYDLFAIRIIIDVPMAEEKAACWRIYSLLTDLYSPNTSRLRDWVSIPKANGYESLHTTVMSREGRWVEAQIRTKRMDEIAEKGVAAHWKYKNKGEEKGETGIEPWLSRVREMLEQNSGKAADALDFMDDFRTNFFNDEVYVFTPKGDLRSFPSSSTVLDFAFDIHTEVGAKCMGAKVNNRLVPLDYVLQNGDQVEILRSSKIQANDGWYRMVVTSRARSKIRDYLKLAERKQTALGREVVLRKLAQLKIEMSSEVARKLCDFFNVKNESELFLKVAKKQIDHTQIKKFVDHDESKSKHRKIRADDAKTFKAQLREVNKDAGDELIIGEETGSSVVYTLATCCNPIPGDEIFGITTLTRGIRIHRTGCPNATDIMASFGNRIIRTRWQAKSQDELYEFNIRIIGTDRIGLVNDVTRTISQQKVNITAISFSTRGNVFEGDVGLSVHDRDEVEVLIESLKGISGVARVMRFD